MRTGSIASQYFLSILRILENMGLPRSELLGHIKVLESDLFNPKFRLDTDKLLEALNFASEKLDEPNIGMKVGYSFRVHTFTETGSVLALCGTLAEAAQINSHYQPLVETMGVSSLERRNSGAYFLWKEGYVDHNKYRHITELIFSGYATTINWLSWGFDKGVSGITFRHDAPRDLSDYELVFGDNIQFSQVENAILFNPKAVDKVLPTSSPEKLTYIRSRLDIYMQSLSEKSDIRERVTVAIREAIRDHRLSFSIVAGMVKLSERQLRNALTEEGVKYRELVERVRRELCRAYMQDGRSLTDIAQILGYNDQSAFTRAFKNWYGVAPSEFKMEVISL